MSSSTPTTRLDRIALIVTGILLGGIWIGLLGFLFIAERSSEGSWWNLAAFWLPFLLGGTLFIGGTILLVRRGWFASPRFTRREGLAQLALGLGAGAISGVVQALMRPDLASIRGGALRGMTSALSLLFMLWVLRRLTPPRNPAPSSTPHPGRDA